jgi:hypothetical protein
MARRTRFSQEVRERAVRMVFEHGGQYGSEWEALGWLGWEVGGVASCHLFSGSEVAKLPTSPRLPWLGVAKGLGWLWVLWVPTLSGSLGKKPGSCLRGTLF